mgnify:CR=1 FL=1
MIEMVGRLRLKGWPRTTGRIGAEIKIDIFQDILHNTVESTRAELLMEGVEMVGDLGKLPDSVVFKGEFNTLLRDQLNLHEYIKPSGVGRSEQGGGW